MRALAVLLLVILAASTLASAHQKTWVNATGDRFIAPNDCAGDLGFSQGGVCYAAGHIVPNIAGEAVVSLMDKKIQPVSGCFQQPGRPCESFCGSALLERNINWDPAEILEIFVDGPVYGNAFDSVCGTLYSGGVWGRASHT